MAESEDFAFLPQWLALLHYQKTFSGSYEATINNRAFYLTEQGRVDPYKELEETIKLFSGEDEEKICRFPARYILLKQNGLIEKSFPKCKEYQKFVDDLKPSGITLLFTDAYMNNSSSLFGHTLFRIDTFRKGSQLLGHSANYGAFTKGYEDSPFYALYGLFGMFPGGLTTQPYYNITNLYNNDEYRDIWEYGLNLSDYELELMVAHVWEISQITTPYYFFSQNCSYMLMEMLDAVRPELKLAADFPVHAIPLDTVKALHSREGLVKYVEYRPSKQKKVRYRMRQMNQKQLRAFSKAVHQKDLSFEGLNDAQKADVIETLYHYLEYLLVAKKITRNQYKKRVYALLTIRNKTIARPVFDNLKEGNDPVFSHGSNALSFSVGNRNGAQFEQINFRPAYHSLTDNPFGFLKGASINFLDFSLRHYDPKDQYVLQKLSILELASLSPIDRIFKAVSYRINLDISRETNPKDEHDLYVLNGEIEAGATFEPKEDFFVYAMFGNKALYGGGLKNNSVLALTYSAGMLFYVKNTAVQTEVKKVVGTQKAWSPLIWKISADYHISSQISLAVSYEHTDNSGKDINETVLGLKYYF